MQLIQLLTRDKKLERYVAHNKQACLFVATSDPHTINCCETAFDTHVCGSLQTRPRHVSSVRTGLSL